MLRNTAIMYNITDKGLLRETHCCMVERWFHMCAFDEAVFVHGVEKLVVAVLLGKVPTQVVGRWLLLGVQTPFKCASNLVGYQP